MNIHRCRFIPFKPETIQQISSAVCQGMPLVAVGRANNEIELWRSARTSTGNRRVNWICQHRIQHAQPIESLIMTKSCDIHDLSGDSSSEGERDEDEMQESTAAVDARFDSLVPRLFVATAQGSITEYSLESLKSIAEVDSFGGGAIWCMSVSPCRKYLAVGCEDGCIRLYDIDGLPGTLQYIRCFERQKARIVSITWNQSSQNENSLSGYFLFTGGSDGLIRKWDPSTGRSLTRMTVGTVSPKEELLVWSVVSLANDAVASADSMGNIKIWDSRTCTLRQSFNAHSADALSLCTNRKGDALFSAGLDNKLTMFCEVKSDDSSEPHWILSQSRKFHTHDVRAIHWMQEPFYDELSPKNLKRARNNNGSTKSEVKTNNGPIVDFLFSGGVDTLLTVIPRPSEMFLLKNYQPTRLLPFHQESVVRFNTKRRLVVGHVDNRVVIYQLGCMSSDTFQNLSNSNGAKFIAEIRVKSPFVVKSVEVSDEWLVVLDSDHQLHVYYVKETGYENSPLALVNMSAYVDDAYRHGCFQVRFIDSSRIVLLHNQDASVIQLKHESGNFSATKSMPISKIWKQPFLSMPSSLTLSKCGRYISTLNAWNDVYIIDLKKKKQIRVPREPNSLLGPSIFYVCPITSHPLLIYTVFGNAAAQTRLRVFDVTTKKFHVKLDMLFGNISWLTSRKEKICGLGIQEIEESGEALFVWSNRWIGRLELPKNDEKTPQPKWNVTTHFENVIGFGILGTEFAVVEKPWIDVLQELPPPVSVKQYGL